MRTYTLWKTAEAASKAIDLGLVETQNYLYPKLANYQEQQRIKNIAESREAARRMAKRRGLEPVPDVHEDFKKQLCERIILEVRKQKLTHMEVAWFVRASRPKITRLLNKNLKGISLEFLLRTSCCLGINVTIHF